MTASSERKVLGTLAGVPVVTLTYLRIRQEEREEGLFYYNLRHSDEDWGDPYSLEKHVLVNHFGTIATMEPIPLLEENNEKNDKWIELTEADKDFIFNNL